MKNVALLIWEVHPASNQGRLWEKNKGQVLSIVYWRRDHSGYKSDHDASIMYAHLTFH